MDFDPPTWRALGLGIATTYITLGTLSIIRPSTIAQIFGLYPTKPSPGSNAVPTRTATAPPTHANADVAAHASAVDSSMILLGARDVSMGLAIGMLAYDGQLKEAGKVILVGVVFCVVDVFEIARLKGANWGAGFAAMAATFLGVGYGMVQAGMEAAKPATTGWLGGK